MKFIRLFAFLMMGILLSTILRPAMADLSSLLATPTGSFPDQYEDPPFSDSSADTTQNSLVPNNIPQNHTFHELDDEDWVIALPSNQTVDGPGLNLGAKARYGPWKMFSNRPDRVSNEPGTPLAPRNPAPNVLLGQDIPYDPTDGTVSFGNILRTQRDELLPVRP